MSDDVYHRLAKVLDTLPNGFPPSPDGIEVRLLQKIFNPDEADLFCDLRLSFETPQQIAQRTGRALEGLEEKLSGMRQKGQVMGVDLGEVKIFRMVPWLFGIFEFQLPRLDKELAELAEAYMKTFGPPFFANKPQLMQILPVEQKLPDRSSALPYQQISAILENGQSFSVNECICKKERKLLGHACSHPSQVCLAIAPLPGYFETTQSWGKPITREQAYALMDQAEESGLVHMTNNYQGGHFFICNCCACCCGVLRAINEWGLSEGVNSQFYARIDPAACVACGTCAEKRCQVRAIAEADGTYRVIAEKCIGCGLCVTTCPSQAISLLKKDEKHCTPPPADEKQWFKQRGMMRGVDFSRYA
jgi:NAD-dependent dihydropyrimidine dehydrogenase PreA subunit